MENQVRASVEMDSHCKPKEEIEKRLAIALRKFIAIDLGLNAELALAEAKHNLNSRTVSSPSDFEQS